MHIGKKTITNGLTACFAGLLAVALAGCGDKNNGPKDTAEPSKTEPSANATEAQEHPAKSEPAHDAHDGHDHAHDGQNHAHNGNDHADDKNMGVGEKPEWDEDTRENQRQLINDAIYAQIRLQMEQAIVERKQMLDAGTPASDEKVRALEGKIMKARSLLIANGEDVEDVDPPIVITNP